MKTKDNLRAYMKELPLEEPSADFTKLVMQRIRIEAIRAQIDYRPLINGQIWWRIFAGIVIVFVGAILLQYFFPGNDISTLTPSFYKIDLTFLLKPFQLFSNALNVVSLNSLGSVAAISLLLFADYLYTRITER